MLRDETELAEAIARALKHERAAADRAGAQLARYREALEGAGPVVASFPRPPDDGAPRGGGDAREASG